MSLVSANLLNIKTTKDSHPSESKLLILDSEGQDWMMKLECRDIKSADKESERHVVHFYPEITYNDKSFEDYMDENNNNNCFRFIYPPKGGDIDFDVTGIQLPIKDKISNDSPITERLFCPRGCAPNYNTPKHTLLVPNSNDAGEPLIVSVHKYPGGSIDIKKGETSTTNFSSDQDNICRLGFIASGAGGSSGAMSFNVGGNQINCSAPGGGGGAGMVGILRFDQTNQHEYFTIKIGAGSKVPDSFGGVSSEQDIRHPYEDTYIVYGEVTDWDKLDEYEYMLLEGGRYKSAWSKYDSWVGFGSSWNGSGASGGSYKYHSGSGTAHILYSDTSCKEGGAGGKGMYWEGLTSYGPGGSSFSLNVKGPNVSFVETYDGNTKPETQKFEEIIVNTTLFSCSYSDSHGRSCNVSTNIYGGAGGSSIFGSAENKKPGTGGRGGRATFEYGSAAYGRAEAGRGGAIKFFY